MSAIKRQLYLFFKDRFAGKKRFQRFFNLINRLSLLGLNFGNGAALAYSGEIMLMDMLTKKFKESRRYIIFDVGANQGDYAIEILNHLKITDLQIWCFEPSEFTFSKLTNALGKNINVVLKQNGFSNENSALPLYAADDGAHTASLFALERAYGSAEKLHNFEMVDIKTIDDFIAENNIPYIDLLKLDIEGNELNALFGAEKALKNGAIRHIQFEFGTCNIDSRTYFRDFWNLLSDRYNIYRILKDGLQPVTFYTEYDEIFSTVNYYAELK